MWRGIDRGKGTCVFMPQIAVKAGTGPGASQEPGVSSWTPTWVYEALGPAFSAFTDSLAGKGIRSGAVITCTDT